MRFTIVKGAVTDPSAHSPPVQMGETEWQISDGPSGKRSVSYDFTCSLHEAIERVQAMHPQATFHLEGVKP